jgi:hypothetical protein
MVENSCAKLEQPYFVKGELLPIGPKVLLLVLERVVEIWRRKTTWIARSDVNSRTHRLGILDPQAASMPTSFTVAPGASI